METRIIKLPNGTTMEVIVHPGFYEAIKKQFMLQPHETVTDEHVRMFVYGSVNSAVTKAERDFSMGPDGGYREEQR